MIYYILLSFFLLCTASNLSSNKNTAALTLDNYLYFITLTILVCFAGLRFDTGWDYKGYHYYYDLIPSLDVLFGNWDVYKSIYFEPGFKMLMSFSKMIGLDFYYFQFLVSLVCIVLIHKSIREEKSKLLFLFVYFTTCYLFLNMSVIRQGIAVAFLYLALTNIWSENKARCIIYILVGSLFHFSLIVLLPVILIANKKSISNKILYITVLGAIFIYLLEIHWLKNVFTIISPILPHDIGYKITTYLDSDRFGRSREIGFGLLEKIVTFVAIYRVYQSERSTKNRILLRIFIFYMIVYFAFYEITVLYDRLRLYFVAVNVFVYLCIFNHYRGYNKIIAYLVIVFYSIFSFMNIFRSESNTSVFMPYYSILESENLIPAEFKGDLRIDRAIDMDH
ncbi:EpsG family protein [Scandinavium sp. NPDC088450]|uniref:EpsG family protein n=1 Tax=Scandinavium sp. NPDC088450 TaxID=3364514 RepID=UPI003850F444